ncbi:hypothetical protein V1273_003591 [Bradyrhizobium sp. AZCC 1721]
MTANACRRSRDTMRPSFCKSFAPQRVRGRRECRVLCCTRGLVCKVHFKNAHTSIQVQPEHPGIPCAMGLRLMPRSPWRRIPFASITDELTARMTRLSAANLRQLDTSHGCQDHTVLPYAASSARDSDRPSACLPKFGRRRLSAVRPARCVRSRQNRPATTSTRPTLPRPPQPVPTFVTMANAPLSGRDGGSFTGDLGLARSGIFLIPGLDLISENQK